MNVLWNKYKPIVLVVVSDDPKLCERGLHGHDVAVMKNKSPAQNLAFMAARDDSIIQSDTFGMWGAILSGRDTFISNLTKSDDASSDMVSQIF
jgi:hypothetical protein